MRYKDLNIVTPNEIIRNGFIDIEDGLIKTIGKDSIEGISLKGLTLMSGFIDMHVHGAYGDDFTDCDSLALNRISHHLLKEGTTSFLATTLTDDFEQIKRVLHTISTTHYTGAKYLGIHLEGPFINKAYHGAQDKNYIIKGSIPLYESLKKASHNQIKLITLAPEVQDETFLKYLLKEDCLLSMGHTAATKEDFLKAYNLGIKRVTHCFNAMKTMHHRDVGLSLMALLKEDVICEMIVDGKHVDFEAVKLLYKLKPNKMVMITDSIRAKGMENGTYLLGPTEITLNDGIAYTKESKLAGSTLFMNQALKNMHDHVETNLCMLTKNLSLYPAQSLNLKNVGEIKVGYHADLVFLDKAFNVMMTLVNGKIMVNNLKEQ
ncbi:MAG: N-acetylglucosamine-6-phosphate deacetylase [Candidatus Izemoplasmataceae bacterium]